MLKAGFGKRCGVLLAAMCSGALLAGCATDDDPSMKQGQGPVASDGNCQEYRAELNKLDSRGVPAHIESANAGKKLSASQRADVDRYNGLLQKYLGSRCHLH